MMDILEKLGVTDERILRAHNSRGFTYLSGILEVVGLDGEGVREAATHMFERMNADLVFSDREISPGCKRLFADLRGLECPHIFKLAYVRVVLGHGFYNLENSVVVITFFATTNYL